MRATKKEKWPLEFFVSSFKLDKMKITIETSKDIAQRSPKKSKPSDFVLPTTIEVGKTTKPKPKVKGPPRTGGLYLSIHSTL